MNRRLPAAFVFALAALAALTVVAALAALAPGGARAAAKFPEGASVRFGILYDSESGVLTYLGDAIEEQIRELLTGDYTPVFARRVTLDEPFELADAREKLRALLDDPEIDIVLTVGYVASTAAVHMGPYAKPVIAPFAIDAELQGLKPGPGGGSGIANLSYLSAPEVATTHIEVLRRIAPIQTLGVIGPAAMFATNPRWQEEAEELAEDYGIAVVQVPYRADIAATVAAIPEDVDAVSVLTHSLTFEEIRELAAALIDRELPSFSFVGGRDVKLGLLAGIASDEKFARFARRVALNVQRILLGAEPSELPVSFALDAQLTVNLATARALGLSLPWEVRLEAEVVDAEPPSDAPRFTLKDVMLEARRVSPDLRAGEEAIASGEQDVSLARARLLPQAEVSTRGVWIDEDRAAASFGSQAEKTLTASATLSQILYSDKAWGDYSIQKQLQDARELELEQLRLDVTLEAATAFLNVLRASTLERIQRENLQLTQSNLKQARVRERIGVAGPAEVYRWEAETAQRRQELIRANSQRNLAEIQLNRVLNRPLEGVFVAQDVGMDEGATAVDENWMRVHLTDPVSFRRLRLWIEEQAQEHAPELKTLDAAIAAQELALRTAGRAYYIPTLAVQGEYERTLDKSGAGAEGFALDLTSVPPSQQGAAALLGSVFPETPDDDSWSIGLSLSLPLLEGGARRAEQLKARRDLEQLRRQREAVSLRVAQRARAAAHTAGASFASIRHALDAAAAAERSLDVVQDAYRWGTADVLDLLDAQNAALVAAQIAANAVYDFLIDYMNVERAMGRFELILEPQERAQLLDELERFMAGTSGQE